MFSFRQYLKSKLPKTILYRFVLIVLLPLFLMQFVYFSIFFNRYWNTTLNKNISIITDEILGINEIYNELQLKYRDREIIINKLNIFKNIIVNLSDRQNSEQHVNSNWLIIVNKPIKNFIEKLNNLDIGEITFYKKNNDFYSLEINKNDVILSFLIHKDRIFVKRMDLIIFWNLLSFFIVSFIAIIFIRNQVRSIKALEKFANDFSYLEKSNDNFKPKGAKEIREVGNAFMKLIKRFKQLISTRTTMLAQISHDLRTPLARIKLQMEFIDDKEIVEFFRQNIEEMEKMINEYLLFAKGEIENDFKQVNIKNFFDKIVEDYKKNGYNIGISYNLHSKITYLKVDSFRRCINNLVNNALNYKKNIVHISIKTNKQFLIINVEDDGNGIPDKFIDKVKNPFFTLNNNCNNVGLGLSIVKNIVSIHRGRMFFKKSTSYNGLNVELNIPIFKNKKSVKNVR